MTSSRGKAWWNTYCFKVPGGYSFADLPEVIVSDSEYNLLHAEWDITHGQGTYDRYDELNQWFLERISIPSIPDPFEDMEEAFT